jgi:hypothetical protein
MAAMAGPIHPISLTAPPHPHDLKISKIFSIIFIYIKNFPAHLPSALENLKNFLYNIIVKENIYILKKEENNMDLYEALKQGTSSDELVNAFYRDLNIAKTRIKEEEEEAKKAAEMQEYLEIARENFANAMLEYTAALTGYFDLVEDAATYDSMMVVIEDLLSGLETEFVESKKNTKSAAKTKTDSNTDTKDKSKDKNTKNLNLKQQKSDEEIIRAFLETLK